MCRSDPWASIQLAKSILGHATPDTAARAIDEARAALDGTTLTQLLERREENVR